MAETGLNRRQIFTLLTRSPHGKLDDYLAHGLNAAESDPDYFAHLIAWNGRHGQVRDAKTALPIIALKANGSGSVFTENALAHLALLPPRELLKALVFAKAIGAPQRLLKRLVNRYLMEIESDQGVFIRRALQHRRALHTLYALCHLDGRRLPLSTAVLFRGGQRGGKTLVPPGVFAGLSTLAALSPIEAAGFLLKHRVPFLTAMGALGPKLKEPELVMALIKGMTPTELVSNTKLLERLGVKSVPALRATYEEALAAAAAAKTPKATLKTTRAAQAVDDEQLSDKLKAVQEKQLDHLGIDGNWLVLGDKSGSMVASIEGAKLVASVLARLAKGSVYLVFFDISPRAFDVTGWSYDKIMRVTQTMVAAGSTSIGTGLQWALSANLDIDGIALVSDGCENTPPIFADQYQWLRQRAEKDIPVYWYEVAPSDQFGQPLTGSYGASVLTNAERNGFIRSCEQAKLVLERFDLTGGVDYYSLPNLVQTMRANRFSLMDEAWNTPLLTLDEVLPLTAGMAVLPRQTQVHV